LAAVAGPLRFHPLDAHLRQHPVHVAKTLSHLDLRPTKAQRLSRLLFGALAEFAGNLIDASDVVGGRCDVLAVTNHGWLHEIRLGQALSVKNVHGSFKKRRRSSFMMLPRWLGGAPLSHIRLHPPTPPRDYRTGRTALMQTVLVVEDSPDIAMLEAELIVAAGRRAIVAADGVEALAILADATVDLILLDLNLPRLSGPELLERLAAQPRLSRIPVLVVSANLVSFRSTRQVVGVVAKPFDITEFAEAIDGALRVSTMVSVDFADGDLAE
jgi:CheY-like chemotaxis protein